MATVAADSCSKRRAKAIKRAIRDTRPDATGGPYTLDIQREDLVKAFASVRDRLSIALDSPGQPAPQRR